MAKILLIDDSAQDRKIISRQLSQAGFSEIELAETGEDGVAKARNSEFDLVISDTILPGMDGFEVCKSIREASGPDKPKIIVMTGAIDAVNAVKARKLGANDYCAKTSDGAPLLEAVKKLI